MLKDLLRKIYTLKIISFFLKILAKPWKGNGAILAYHRVLPDNKMHEDLNIGLAISCSKFEKQMQILKKYYSLVSIDKFVESVNDKNSNFLVSITFDDGYIDNLKYALPILEKYKIPATIYISTRFLENDVSMWWYELKNLIENNSNFNFKYKEKYFNFTLENKKQKEIAFQKLRRFFLNLQTNDQLNLLEIISQNKKRENYSHQCLSPDDLQILDNNPLITIGSHSHNHLNLKILEKKEVISEIKKSLEILKNLLSHKVKHFAYPYGGNKEASLREYNLVEEFDLTSAVTSRVYPIKKLNLFSLPRIYVGTNTCEKSLINHLSGFYNLLHKFF